MTSEAQYRTFRARSQSQTVSEGSWANHFTETGLHGPVFSSVLHRTLLGLVLLTTGTGAIADGDV